MRVIAGTRVASKETQGEGMLHQSCHHVYPHGEWSNVADHQPSQPRNDYWVIMCNEQEKPYLAPVEEVFSGCVIWEMQ